MAATKVHLDSDEGDDKEDSLTFVDRRKIKMVLSSENSSMSDWRSATAVEPSRRR